MYVSHVQLVYLLTPHVCSLRWAHTHTYLCVATQSHIILVRCQQQLLIRNHAHVTAAHDGLVGWLVGWQCRWQQVVVRPCSSKCTTLQACGGAGANGCNLPLCCSAIYVAPAATPTACAFGTKHQHTSDMQPQQHREMCGWGFCLPGKVCLYVGLSACVFFHRQQWYASAADTNPGCVCIYSCVHRHVECSATN